MHPPPLFPDATHPVPRRLSRRPEAPGPGVRDCVEREVEERETEKREMKTEAAMEMREMGVKREASGARGAIMASGLVDSSCIINTLNRDSLRLVNPRWSWGWAELGASCGLGWALFFPLRSPEVV